MENSDSTTKPKTAGETISYIFIIFYIIMPFILMIILLVRLILFNIDDLKHLETSDLRSAPFLIYVVVGIIFAIITEHESRKNIRFKKQQKKLRKKEEKKAEKLALFKEKMKEWEKTNEGPMPPQM